MKLVRSSLLSVFLVSILLFSCSGPYKGYKESESGLRYKFIDKNECDRPATVGDLINFSFTMFTPDTTYTDSAFFVEKQMLGESQYQADVYEALGMMCEGDSASFVFNTDSLIRYFGFSFLDSAENVFFNIKLHKIFTPEMIQAEEDSLYKAEMIYFEQYKVDNLTEYTELAPGVWFKELVKGKGMHISDTAIISLIMYGSTLQGEVFIPENDKKVDFRLIDDLGINLNWNEALRRMTTGGEAELILTSPNAFGRSGFRNQIKPFQTLKLHLKIASVASGMKEFEGYSIREFVSRQDDFGKPLSNGMYYVVKEKGTGEKLKSKDKVMVHYTGFYLDMGVFDSSRERGEPMEVTIDQSDVIKGWHEALKMMRVGEKARFLIPSKLAYGEEGMSPMIRPYSPLIFDLEVVEKL